MPDRKRDGLRARGRKSVLELDVWPHVVHRTDDYELSMCFFRDSEGDLLAIMHESGTI